MEIMVERLMGCLVSYLGWSRLPPPAPTLLRSHTSPGEVKIDPILVTTPDTVIVPLLSCKPPACQKNYTAVLALLEQVYVHLATFHGICTSFPSSDTRQRRLGKVFLNDPYVDGHNIVSTAQMLASRALADPDGTFSSHWPWQYRMKIAACISVAAKMHVDFGFVHSPVNVLALAFCFMTQAEQDGIRQKGRKGTESVLRDVTAAEFQVVQCGIVYSIATFGPIQKVEHAMTELLDSKYFVTPREALVCRNLCVFQFRAVVRRNVCLLGEDRVLHLALIAVALRWMGLLTNEVQFDVQRVAEEVLVCVSLVPTQELLVGDFLDPCGALGPYVSKPVFELVKLGSRGSD